MNCNHDLTRREFLTASTAAVGLVGLGVPPISDAQPVKKGGVLRYAHAGDIYNFDPTQLPAVSYAMLFTLFDTLIRFDEKNKPTPQLAESWESTDGSKRLTMKLRKGVTFHTGREFTAEDVIFTVQRFQDKEVGANLREWALYITEAKVEDKYTVRFSMEKPYPPIFDFLDSMFIIDKESINDFKTKGVGTGPFKLKRWIPGDRVIWEKNRNYWKNGRPYLDGVEMLAMPDVSSLAINLEAGAVDVAEGLPASDLKRLQGNPNLDVIIAAVGSQWLDVLINVKRPPFNNPKVRAALDLAIDRKRFTEIFYAGFTKPSCLPFPDYSPAFFEDQAKQCEFNLDKAKKLLNEAGITSLDVTMTVSGPGLYPGSNVLAEMMNADLKKIGINLKIENLPPAQARPKIITNKDFQLASHIFARSNKDPMGMFAGTRPWLLNCEANLTNYCSDRLTKLVEDGRTTLAPEKRKAIFREINELILNERYTLSIAPGFNGFVKGKNVHGFAVGSEPYCILEETWLA